MLFRCAKTGGVALICRLAQQHATLTAKIGIENLHKRCAEFLNAFTASNASAYDYLTTYPRSSLYLALTGAALNMLCMQLRASSSTFSACISTYSVDPKARAAGAIFVRNHQEITISQCNKFPLFVLNRPDASLFY